MSSTNHLAKLSQHVLLVLGEFLDTASLRAAAQVKPLNHVATWTLYQVRLGMALRMKSSVAESPFYDSKEYNVQGNAMHVAASQGHNHILQILMDNGGDINSWTRVVKITFLLDKGASLVDGQPDFDKACVPSSQRRLDAMHIAAKYGQYHLVRYLHLQYGIDIDLPDQWGNAALEYAMESSENLHVINYLISEGADLELMDDGGLTPLHRAMTLPDAEGANLTVAESIVARANMNTFTNIGRETPMTIAIRFAQSSLVAMLVDAGVFVPSGRLRGSKPQKAIAKLLASRHMSNKAIVSLMNPSINIRWRGKKNKTLLHTFAENVRWHTRDSDFSVLQALLDCGIDVNARARGGLTVLHILVADNHISSGSDDQVWFAEVLDRLLARGLDINAVDNKGWTALHHLANSQVIDRCVTLVEALVHRGIEAHVRDTVASRTALDVLLEFGEERRPETSEEYIAIVSSYQSTRTPLSSRRTTRTRLGQSTHRPNSTRRPRSI
ncbi:hypothetical protein N0V84_005057 [Fusarium piperis]|uniref:Ankyrin n=1 Tax=Fusarium piperis TaxID=1435070 RepID=A0A9W9BPA3_9HYPO|nr:hypothetical protein N0V84_005057 [Fusarium piperis]